jgi:hypothetical protein
VDSEFGDAGDEFGIRPRLLAEAEGLLRAESIVAIRATAAPDQEVVFRVLGYSPAATVFMKSTAPSALNA